MTDRIEPDKLTDEELHEEALERYHYAEEAWHEIHKQYRDDVLFAGSDQWSDDNRKLREDAGLSCLTYNKIKSKILWIVNNARANTPDAKIHPLQDSNKPTADILSGVIRSINYRSNAKSARINALTNTVSGGLGVWRILLTHDIDGDKDYDISEKRILDPTTFLIDPDAVEEDFSDAEYCFIVSWVNRKLFEKQYPDDDASSVDSSSRDWYTKDKVQVVEYWKKDNGRINQYLISGKSILSKTENYPGKYLPFAFMVGEEIAVGDHREYKGVVRDVADMQILLNMSKSQMADYIVRSSTPPFMAEADMISDNLEDWRNPNSGKAVLLYKSVNGAKPERMDPATPPSAYIEAAKEADEDIRQTIGIRDPSADIPSSQSGKAISLQIGQSNTGTFHFLDKFANAIKYATKVELDLIPYVYNKPHILEVLGYDGSITTAHINEPFQDENGDTVYHDLTKGKYDVTISTGPSYESQRSEMTDKLIELVGKFPQMMQFAGDLIVKNLDFEGSDEMAARLQAAIPPQILQASGTGSSDNKKQQQIMQLTSQLQQLQQGMQQLQQENQQLQQTVQTKQVEQQGKLQQTQLEAQARIQLEQAETNKELKLQQMKLENEIALKAIETKYSSQLESLKDSFNTQLTLLKAALDDKALDKAGAQKIEQIHAKAHADIFEKSMEIQERAQADKDAGQDIMN